MNQLVYQLINHIIPILSPIIPYYPRVVHQLIHRVSKPLASLAMTEAALPPLDSPSRGIESGGLEAVAPEFPNAVQELFTVLFVHPRPMVNGGWLHTNGQEFKLVNG